ncbi:hypothetical protein Tco_0863855 [Tanacetum coccineum]
MRRYGYAGSHTLVCHIEKAWEGGLYLRFCFCSMTQKEGGHGINPEKMVVPVLYGIQQFAIANGTRVGTFAERHPPFILGTGIKHTEAIDRRLKAVDAIQDLKMRNFSRPEHRQLKKMNAKMVKNIHKELRQRDPIVGKIKKPSIYTNLAIRTL